MHAPRLKVPRVTTIVVAADETTRNFLFIIFCNFSHLDSPHKYTESEVTLQYRRPVRSEIKEDQWSEEELANKQAEAMRRIYQEERRRKYLQELQDMSNRRHADNLLLVIQYARFAYLCVNWKGMGISGKRKRMKGKKLIHFPL